MSIPKAIGAIELSSIGIGYQVQDDMLKAASVEVLIARTICSGKYLIVVGGSVSDVEAAVQAGLNAGRRGDHRQPHAGQCPPGGLSGAGPSVALTQQRVGALGVVETFSGVSVLAAADRAAKAARVPLPHPCGHGPGRQGPVPDDRQRGGRAGGVQAAAEEARERGLLVSEIVIPRPSRELFADYL